jgi:hypothetical protein
LTANLDFVQGNPIMAYQKLKRVRQISPYFVSANQKDFANAWYALAIRFSELKRFSLSLECALLADEMGIPLKEETRKELEENAEMETLFHPERTKEIQ